MASAEARNEREAGFLLGLRAQHDRARGFDGFEVWHYYPQLVVTLVIIDDTHGGGVLRTLRADFDGTALVCGNDPSHRIDPAIDAGDPDRYEALPGLSPRRYGELAYGWFRQQALRPIDRLEWDGETHGWVRRVLADSGAGLGGRYAPLPDRPPDRAVRLEAPAFGRD